MNETGKRFEDYRRLIAIVSDLASTLDLDVLLNRITRANVDISGDIVQGKGLIFEPEGLHG